MKVLLTSVCRPIGPAQGDNPSVGYELLHRQITRAQGIFSPRALHLMYSLDYIAENLDAPTVVLQYPSREEFIKELKKGYDYIGVSFIIALLHKLKESIALIREYSPQSKIVLGGYGTIMSDEELKPYGDYICRGEGVAFFRKLLGEPEKQLPYRQPLIVSQLKIFSLPVSHTGMIFGGLGCPNGCDFCCTSHFFKRKHITLLPTGQDIHNLIKRYLKVEPDMAFVVLDEDFLLNKKRAMDFRDCVQKDGRPISIFVMSSIRAISQYTVDEILEMGVSGFWIGYEGVRSGYGKQQGRPVGDIFREFREHGITVLSSMIIGFDYQNKKIIAEEHAGLMELKPDLAQFLIYGPTPGTPFYDRIIKEKRLNDDLSASRETYYRKCDGFSAMIKHPTMSAREIEQMQEWCFEEDYQRLGPSMYRIVETTFLGYMKLKNSPKPFLRKIAERFGREARAAYPVFLIGSMLGPNRAAREHIRELRRKIYAEIGAPTMSDKIQSIAVLAAAAWTWFTLQFDAFQHPALTRNSYRENGKDTVSAAARNAEKIIFEAEQLKLKNVLGFHK